VNSYLANLVDFDQAFGHRNDAAGFYGALREFDAALPMLLASLQGDDLLFITADHGNDPTTASTDHARECVPLLVLGPRVRPGSVGTRSTFSDLGATVAEWFGIGFRGRGTSFLTASSADMAVEQRPGVEPTGDERTLTMLRERAFAAWSAPTRPIQAFGSGRRCCLGQRRGRVQRRKRVVPGGYLRGT
jgi:hypothetical protein